MTWEHVRHEVGLDVRSSVVAKQRRYEQRGDAAECQKQREADATEQREVKRHFDLQWLRQLDSPQHEHVQSCSGTTIDNS